MRRSRSVREDAPEDEAQGSVLSFCSGLLAAGSLASESLHAASEPETHIDDQLEILQLWADQALSALSRCQERFKSSLETLQRADALKGEPSLWPHQKLVNVASIIFLKAVPINRRSSRT